MSFKIVWRTRDHIEYLTSAPKYQQFGDELDDEALKELASGPLIRRIHLSANRPDGLQECTREMFALAMLVRLGKVTEDDILDTFNAFGRLDVSGEGVLNSRSIIAGMINKSRHKANLAGFSSGMPRVSSTNSMLKASRGTFPAANNRNPDYMMHNTSSGNNNMHPSSYNTPRNAQRYGTNPVRIPTRVNNDASTERSSLLHRDSDYSMLSRSQE